MLVSAAVLPHPPALVPAVAAGAAHELESVRAACTAALEQVRSAEPDLVVLVGGGSALATFGPGSAGSLAGFGVPVGAALAGAVPEAVATLPLSLTVGAWLLAQRDRWPPVRAEAVPQTVTAGEAMALGRSLAGAAARVAIIAMGDGSAALTVKAPGYLVDGAKLWQKRVTQALVDVDLDVIAAIDADEASAFVVAGRPAWQVLAGAAAAGRWAQAPPGAGQATGSGRWRGDLLADESPYGVAYLVVTWTWEQAWEQA